MGHFAGEGEVDRVAHLVNEIIIAVGIIAAIRPIIILSIVFPLFAVLPNIEQNISAK